MKKIVVVAGILLVLFVIGCVDYKAYDIPKEEQNEDSQLVDEIAAIENELANEKNSDEPAPAEEIVEEVVLPELEETPVAAEPMAELTTISVKENDIVRLNVNVSDPDNDPVTYTFSKPLSEKGEWKTNYGDAGEYVITIMATDGKLTSEKKIKIIVQRVNVPPVISLAKDLIVDEGAVVTFKPNVTDPNKDVVTVTVSEPLKDGVFETDHTSAGEYRIEILATDGELDAKTTFKLIVNDVNVLPEVTNLEDLEVDEGDVVKIEPRVTDLDGDELTVTISEPVGNDGVWETKYTDHGTYDITVTVDDGKDKVVKKIKVTVHDVNMPPQISDVNLAS